MAIEHVRVFPRTSTAPERVKAELDMQESKKHRCKVGGDYESDATSDDASDSSSDGADHESEDITGPNQHDSSLAAVRTKRLRQRGGPKRKKGMRPFASQEGLSVSHIG